MSLMPSQRIIFHIDVNSAYLSWTAAYRLQQGYTTDLRTIPSVIGGDELSRHGIVLAKSIPAKAFGIQTGSPLRTALDQCPELTIVPPDYHLYQKASHAMVDILRKYSSSIQRFSVDECFLDYTHSKELFGCPLTAARLIKEEIKTTLGCTVNIGISTNKLLAKMASDFKKPDRIHTLYHDEIPDKMWPLPVSDLFMVGRQTSRKLHNLGILTIGDLAHTSPKLLEQHLHSFGLMIYQYANGVDHVPVRKSNIEVIKGLGNSTTVPHDVESRGEALLVLLSLCENVAIRLRQGRFCCSLVSVSIVYSDFTSHSHQRKLDVATESTNYIYDIATELFDELWKGANIRKLGIRLSELQENSYFQSSLLVDYNFEKQRRLDTCMDGLRFKYGNSIIQRASFLHTGHAPVKGGIGEDGYPVMTSIL